MPLQPVIQILRHQIFDNFLQQIKTCTSLDDLEKMASATALEIMRTVCPSAHFYIQKSPVNLPQIKIIESKTLND